MTRGSENHPVYEYVCESPQDIRSPLLHTHRILVKQRRSLGFLTKCLSVLLIGSAAFFSGLQWILVLVVLALLVILRRRNGVEQEAVVVMPTLGIQLETVYRSKTVKRRFVPLHRILWPVINEAVTPTTCFTYLALLIRDDSRLTLTFLHVRPPLSMLVPIWTALCEALGHPPPRKLLQNKLVASSVIEGYANPMKPDRRWVLTRKKALKIIDKHWFVAKFVFQPSSEALIEDAVPCETPTVS